MASTVDTTTFNTGATRNNSEDRIDPEGFLSPEVLNEFFAYMHKNRYRPNNAMRDSDNWQLGIPQRNYVKSLWRHFFDLWREHRKQGNHMLEPSPYRNAKLIEDCCAVMFNSMGYLFEELKKPTSDPNVKLKKEEFITGLATFPRQTQSGTLCSPMMRLQRMSDEHNDPRYGWGV